jgi:uncharacterized protein
VIPMRPVVEGEDKQPDFSTVQAVLDGVRDLLSERWAENPALVQRPARMAVEEGLLRSRLMDGKDENHADVAKFRDYFDYDEPIGRVPSHRALAVFRGRAGHSGRQAGACRSQTLDQASRRLLSRQVARQLSRAATRGVRWLKGVSPCAWAGAMQGRAADDLIRKCVAWTWRVKLSLSTERDLFARCAKRLKKSPSRCLPTICVICCWPHPPDHVWCMGLDPGIRTGVKVAVVDATGKLVETATVFPHEPRKDWDGSLHTLGKLCMRHGVNLIAIGNGTASRETDKLAADLIKLMSKRLQPAQNNHSLLSKRWWSARPALRSTRPANLPRRKCPMWTSACAVPPALPGVCRTRWPNWSRSTPRALVWASTSMM